MGWPDLSDSQAFEGVGDLPDLRLAGRPEVKAAADKGNRRFGEHLLNALDDGHDPGMGASDDDVEAVRVFEDEGLLGEGTAADAAT
jgi:hypothetical protein